MHFEIKIEGVEELKAEAAAGVTQLSADIAKAATHATEVAIRQIEALAPFKTGALHKSIKGRIRRTANGATGAIVIGADHASYVKDGTPAHQIVAKNLGVGGRLKFEIGGRTIFRRSVNHPGTAPNDFVTPGVTEGQQVADHDADAAVKKLKARIEG